jgi:4'-phosphopantetheinyl transferase EntD
MSIASKARLSPRIAALFGPGVVAAELLGPGEPASLLPEEAKIIGGCAPKRAQDFAAGRQCARLAMVSLGVHSVPLLSAADRVPLWPVSLVGSITHTAGFCAAAVARRADCLALGLDSEVVDDVNSELWSQITTPAELKLLTSLPPGEAQRMAAIIFAGKEAFYKCQYSLTRAWLDFDDVLLSTDEWAASEGKFAVRTQRSFGAEPGMPLPSIGRFKFHDQWISAGVALVADGR